MRTPTATHAAIPNDPNGNAATANTKLLTRAEASSILGVKIQTMAKWAVTGYGPIVIKVGKLCRYRTRDIEAWIDRQAVGASAN